MNHSLEIWMSLDSMWLLRWHLCWDGYLYCESDLQKQGRCRIIAYSSWVYRGGLHTHTFFLSHSLSFLLPFSFFLLRSLQLFSSSFCPPIPPLLSPSLSHSVSLPPSIPHHHKGKRNLCIRMLSVIFIRRGDLQPHPEKQLKLSPINPASLLVYSPAAFIQNSYTFMK